MTRHKVLLATLALGLGAFVIVHAAPEPEPANLVAKLSKDRINLVRKTYDVKWKNYREGIRTTADALYLWSVRLLEAEKQSVDPHADRLTAYRGHYGRMRDLERLIHDLQRAGQTTVDEVSAAEFYRAEAEFWLAQARAEKKEP